MLFGADSDRSEWFAIALGGSPNASHSVAGPGSPAVSSPEAVTPDPRKPRAHRGNPIYTGIVVVILVVAVVLAYVLTGGFHSSNGSSGSSSTVLIPRGTGYSYNIGQFNGINFVISSESRIQGELNSTHGVAIYILTPAEFEYLVKNLTVGQYVWTSGVVADQSIYHLNVTVQPGQWVLSFVNPNVSWPTGIGFYSDVTLTTI